MKSVIYVILALSLCLFLTVNANAQNYQSTMAYLDKQFANYDDADLQQLRATIIATNVDTVLNHLHSVGGSLSDATKQCDDNAAQFRQSMAVDRKGYLDTHNGGEGIFDQIDQEKGASTLASNPWLKAYIKDHWNYVFMTELKKQLSLSGG